MRLVIRSLSIILLISLIAGCTKSFVYNRLDSLITWYVDGYVELTSEQKTMLKQELKPALQWHRQDELKKNRALLNTVLNDMTMSVDVAQVSAWTNELIHSFQRVQMVVVDVALNFGSVLSDEQMQEFSKSVWQKQAELKEEYLSRSDQEYIQDSYEKLEDRLTDYLGRLTDEQKAILKQAANELRRLDYAWLEDRADWLRRLQPYLQRNNGWQEDIRQLYSDRESYRSDRYKQVFSHNLAIINRAMTDVLNLRNDKQQKVLLAELGKFKDEIESLMTYRQTIAIQSLAKTMN